MSKSEKKPSSLQLHGRVMSFNLSPEGDIEGALVETATGLAQLNFPKRHAEAFARSMPVASLIDLNAELETDKGAHPVYSMGDKETEVTGNIARLNYTREGEVNGYHLESGVFLHVGPKSAKRYEMYSGQQITALGKRRPGTDAVVIDVRVIERANSAPGEEESKPSEAAVVAASKTAPSISVQVIDSPARSHRDKAGHDGAGAPPSRTP